MMNIIIIIAKMRELNYRKVPFEEDVAVTNVAVNSAKYMECSSLGLCWYLSMRLLLNTSVSSS